MDLDSFPDDFPDVPENPLPEKLLLGAKSDVTLPGDPPGTRWEDHRKRVAKTSKIRCEDPWITLPKSVAETLWSALRESLKHIAETP